MTNVFKKIIMLMICLSIFCQPVVALEQGDSYTYDDYGRSIPAPVAYSAITEFDNLGLNNPSDIYVDKNNHIFIADTGNNRIIVLNKDFTVSREITQVVSPDSVNTMNKPQGIFVDDGGLIYICDTNNQRVIAINSQNKVERLIVRPKTELISEDEEFKPIKVVVDSGKYVYVACYGLYQGLVCYNEKNEFSSFYASNKVELTFSTMASYYWKKIFSKEQAESMTRLIPTEYSNIFINEEDFIYTCTTSTSTSLQEIKKLNAAGGNVLHISGYNATYAKDDYGDIEKEWIKGRFEDSRIVDINVDNNGIIAALDNARGRIFGYDNESNLLFIFGNIGDRIGEFFNPVAIENMDEYYLILDSTKNSVTVFAPTNYIKEVRKATVLYSKGQYIESLNLWEDILKQNSNFSLAYRSIGRAYLQQHKYEDAMYYLKKGNDRRQYSLALSGYRKQFIQKNFIYILMTVIVVCFIFSFLLNKLRKKIGIQKKRKKTLYK